MAKTKQSTTQQKTNWAWAVIVLLVAIVGTNWLWYQHHRAQELSLKNVVESRLQQQVQINISKDCIGEGTSLVTLPHKYT